MAGGIDEVRMWIFLELDNEYMGVHYTSLSTFFEFGIFHIKKLNEYSFHSK